MARKKAKQSQRIKDVSGSSDPKKISWLSLFIMASIGAVTFLGGVALIGYNALKYNYVKTGPLETETVFTVPRGAGLSKIANQLEANNLIESAFILKLNKKILKSDTAMKAGEYIIPAGASMRDIADIIESGKSVLYPFTIPEGLTSNQILRRMSDVETLTGDLPKKVVEGTLLPETYLTPRDMSRQDLIRQMQRAQTELINRLWETRQKNLPIKSKAEAIILASVVEKETGIGSERDEVAGVFINRLRKGMRLQSDPTIIYGITGGEPLGRGIRRSEIDRKTDWNTYQINGLPKTPICNPGAEAIAAVLQPAETENLFFVADGTGGHVFAKTVRQHNNNVKKWRKIERQRKRGTK
ncbi:MAG: endolytic transglycosylase MltG [Maricaulaceae bacterium]